MNRYNFGNVTTNAMQIGSTGVFTASRSLGNATSALNNLTKEEKAEYGKMKANKMQDEMEAYKAKKEEQFAQEEFERSEIVNIASEQSDELSKYINSNYKYIQNRVNGKFASGGTFVRKEGNDNADV